MTNASTAAVDGGFVEEKTLKSVLLLLFSFELGVTGRREGSCAIERPIMREERFCGSERGAVR